MTEEPGTPPRGSAEPGPETPDVGSVGEEAAKLFSALSDWTRDHAGAAASGAGGAVQGLADVVREVDEHVATDAAECRYCPVCQVIHLVRDTSPEVREHLAAAAGSLAQAVASLMATPVPRDRDEGVERIPLDDGPGGAGS